MLSILFPSLPSMEVRRSHYGEFWGTVWEDIRLLELIKSVSKPFFHVAQDLKQKFLLTQESILIRPVCLILNSSTSLKPGNSFISDRSEYHHHLLSFPSNQAVNHPWHLVSWTLCLMSPISLTLWNLSSSTLPHHSLPQLEASLIYCLFTIAAPSLMGLSVSHFFAPVSESSF